MKQRYDFSKGERGKFYKPGAVFRLPVYLDEQVERYLAAKGIELFELLNELLKQGIELIEAGGRRSAEANCYRQLDGQAAPRWHDSNQRASTVPGAQYR